MSWKVLRTFIHSRQANQTRKNQLAFLFDFGAGFISPGAITRRTIGVFNLYLRSSVFPL